MPIFGAQNLTLNQYLGPKQHQIFVKLNSPILLVMGRQQEKSQKYFDLSAFN